MAAGVVDQTEHAIGGSRALSVLDRPDTTGACIIVPRERWVASLCEDVDADAVPTHLPQVAGKNARYTFLTCKRGR
jgi:hypothetical protein